MSADLPWVSRRRLLHRTVHPNSAHEGNLFLLLAFLVKDFDQCSHFGHFVLTQRNKIRTCTMVLLLPFCIPMPLFLC